MSQWTKSNAKFVHPVIIKEKSIVKRIERLYQTAENVAWLKATKYQKELLDNDLDKLFDITSFSHQIMLCHEDNSNCKDPISCKIGAHIQCDCPLANKIPQLDLLWLYHQRNKI